MPRTRGEHHSGRIADTLSVHVRPHELNDRVMREQWKENLIKRQGNRSAAGLLVERFSRLVLLAKMDDATAAFALTGFSRKLHSIAAPMRHSLTYHQGKEMSWHVELTEAASLRVYLCDPHSLVTRHVREYQRSAAPVPAQGTDLSVHSQDEFDSIADSLNSRRRATRDYNCLLKVRASMLEASTRSVDLPPHDRTRGHA